MSICAEFLLTFFAREKRGQSRAERMRQGNQRGKETSLQIPATSRENNDDEGS
jgi:hypothetical protein